jgi:hypothetical protein
MARLLLCEVLWQRESATHAEQDVARDEREQFPSADGGV